VLDVVIANDQLRIGERFAASLHRTLRIPDDGRTYPLPPGFGLFPLVPIGSAGAPPQIAVPLYQREALWLGFSAASWKPNALKVIVGGINAVSGLPDDGSALGEPQDYLVCPDQPWLDGFNAGNGVIRQFVAMPLGEGYAVEAGLGRAEQGGIELIVFEPLPGRFPDAPPPAPAGPMRLSRPAVAAEPREMALGAGGQIRQKIYPGRHGRDVWDQENVGRARLLLVNSRRYRELAGREPPATPIDAAAYAAAGLPWFDLYDEAAHTVSPAAEGELKTIRDRDEELGRETGDQPVEIGVGKVTVIDRKGKDNIPSNTSRGMTPESDPTPAAPTGRKPGAPSGKRRK
jgi:hypothetical protein